ncbi:hypothetical protein [Streptomyces sp. NPDC048669]|uniref:hypothetical protein n=1 Tax=Streptomyces sp. NPDC048669 TaxID=3155267 RepID=UPI003447E4E0
MRPAHRVARPALLAAAALLLCACGIPTTGVVEAGESATGIRPAATVYFLKNRALTAVPRKVGRRAEIEGAVAAVFKGPDSAERRAGLTSGLPALVNDPTVRTEGARVRIELDFDTSPQLSAALKLLSVTPSLNQLVCTAAGARQAEDPDIGSVSVTVTASAGDAKGRWRAEGNSGTGCSNARRAPGAVSRPG